ncbi:hypothetical protein F2Q69_00038859 [Brassica cretica]|uniref:Uncharacterized protein n=1 Tax=Brassica cretica TaxID=69181 RepID=A0A8S9SE16_BRACR|nr:hypothetical protein F2Q69_00038859 [Brassica cretica]
MERSTLSTTVTPPSQHHRYLLWRERPSPPKKRGRRKEDEGEAEERDWSGHVTDDGLEEENWASVVDNEAGERLRTREAEEEDEKRKEADKY